VGAAAATAGRPARERPRGIAAHSRRGYKVMGCRRARVEGHPSGSMWRESLLRRRPN
jgi:hypothetical protein